MTFNGWLQIIIYFALLLSVTKPLGVFMTKVYNGERSFLTSILRPLEKLIYKLCGVDEKREMNWKEYSLALIFFSVVSGLVVFLLQRMQGFLPLNPQNLAGVDSANYTGSAFNTAVSFMTNTNWQGYGGETTMSYLTQMAGLSYQNFVSAAVGMAVAVALIRGIVRRETDLIGNFWTDLTRGAIYILLPLSLVFAVVLVSQGVVQNFNSYQTAVLIDKTSSEKYDENSNGTQTLAQGPAASQIAIKQLGTNGGGFFNVNSAHPYENPNPFSNFLQLLAILMIPAGFTFMFGRMVGSQKHGWAVFGAMSALFLAGVFFTYWAESAGNPLYPESVDQIASSAQSGGNMEGKEVRFGIADSVLWGVATTDASNGSVNSMHDSYTPLGGMVLLLNILLGEVIFGGVGAGLYGMLIFIILTVFVAGLMVGRTPEYLGKKIEAFDVKMTVLAILVMPLLILGFTAISVSMPELGLSSRNNTGAHGLTEILYAYSSGAGNNGSAFAGLNANTLWYNATIGISMLFGRFFVILPALAIAGNLARKNAVPPSLGTFPVTTPLFAILLVSVILIVGALTFFPVLSLGPIVEHFLMNAGQTF